MELGGIDPILPYALEVAEEEGCCTAVGILMPIITGSTTVEDRLVVHMTDFIAFSRCDACAPAPTNELELVDSFPPTSTDKSKRPIDCGVSGSNSVKKRCNKILASSLR